MTSRSARTLALALVLGLSGGAMAATAVDIFSAPGVPGTGGSDTVTGPCYCEFSAVYSPVLLLAPGTYELGHVRDWWIESGATPDAGPDQPNLWILFAPVLVAGTYPDDFAAPPLPFPSSMALCDQTDTACNASHDGAFVDTAVSLTVAPGQDAAQVSFFGPFVYTPLVPEPTAGALLALGLACLAASRRRRGFQV